LRFGLALRGAGDGPAATHAEQSAAQEEKSHRRPPQTCAVGNALRGVPLFTERHGGRSLQPQGGYSGLSFSLTSMVLPAGISLVCPVLPPLTQPTPSCHMTMLYLPAGAFLISNLPSASVTAKYGWSNTRIQAFIQRWMSQLICTGLVEAFSSISILPPAGMSLLSPVLSPPPSQCMLCGTGALFLPTSFCPARIAMACGSNLQQGWSMTTSLSLISFRSGWIGSLALGLLASWSQTKTFLTPPFLPT